MLNLQRFSNLIIISEQILAYESLHKSEGVGLQYNGNMLRNKNNESAQEYRLSRSQDLKDANMD